MREHQIQRSVMTETENIRRIGVALNAQYVLSGNIRRLGQTNMFTAQVLDVESGQLIVGDRENYISINDGLEKMVSLASKLIGNTLKLSGQVYRQNVNGTYSQYNHSRDISFGNGFLQGIITEINNGQLNIEINAPESVSLYPLTMASLVNNIIDSRFSYYLRDYDDITFSDNNVRFYIINNLYLIPQDDINDVAAFRIDREYNTYIEGNFFKQEIVQYIYVNRDVTITGKGKTSGTVTSQDFILNLIEGWNPIHIVSTEGNRTRTINIFSGDPDHLLWRIMFVQ